MPPTQSVGPLDDEPINEQAFDGFLNIHDPSLTDEQREEMGKQKAELNHEIAEWRSIYEYVKQPGWLLVLKSVGAETDKLLNNLADEKNEAELHRIQGRLQMCRTWKKLPEMCVSEIERLSSLMDAMFNKPGAKDNANV